LVRGEEVICIPDLAEDAAHRHSPGAQALVRLGGAHSYGAVALRKDDTLLGSITLYRQEVRPFTDKQIALLQNFAEQAVIAMENARLITETREALEQQTATAEVLQVINSSPGDLQPVFDAMLEKALRLCDAVFGIFRLYDGSLFQHAASRGPSTLMEKFHHGPLEALPGSPLEQVLNGATILHFSDLRETDEYKIGIPGTKALVELGGARTYLMVTLRKEQELLGLIAVYRREVRPFTDKQATLLQNFAAQAVIAMENARLLTETREALEQQTATAEVLQVINSSPGDLAPVFDAILEKATRVCEAAFGAMLTWDGERVHWVAFRGLPTELVEALQQPMTPGDRRPVADRIVRGETVISTPDLREADYRDVPIAQAFLRHGARSCVHVAMRKEERLLGYFTIYREQVRPFSEKEIALLQNFAAQAVIAMENARLITETREALEQQTATAEVLGVINASPGNITRVFEAIVEKAMRLCDAAHGALRTYEGQDFHLVAAHGQPHAVEQLQRLPIRPIRGSPFELLTRGESVVHIADVREQDLYRNNPSVRERLDLGSIRTWLAVALQKEGVLLGAIIVYRQEVRPFTDKQIALLQNFAAQAVIAMENARLLTETREALEQQTATAEVLQVINSSPGDLTPVFDAMLDKAVQLCAAAHGSLRIFDGEAFHLAATDVGERFAVRAHRLGPIVPYSGHPMAPLTRGEPFVQLEDARDTAAYHSDAALRQRVDDARIRSWLAVALRKNELLLGAILLHREEVRPFSSKEIALVQNFAAQAVIAMENARLITETREALEQQTATAEVLGVINSSPGDLAPVFDAILEKAMRLCDAAFGFLSKADDEVLNVVAVRNMPEKYAESIRQPHRLDQVSVAAEVIRRGQVIQINDLADTDAYRQRRSITVAAVEFGRVRSVLYVPLMKDDRALGVIVIFRQEVRPFSDKQIALLQNFAAQAVIAIENARLLTETREALEQQTATAEVLGVINSSPGNLTPVFDAMLEKATRLCEAPFGILRTWDGECFHLGAVHGNAPGYRDWAQQRGPIPVRPSRDNASPLGRILAGERIVHFADAPGGEGSITSSGFRDMLEASGVRSAIWVALRKDDALLGVIIVYRQEVRPFTDKQIALLQSFAAQAVIAMENARLLGELHQRTDEVAELNRGLEARVAEQVDELGRVGRLKRFLAPQLAELIVSQGDEKILESHRREIVVVFCDLRGYTAFTETAEPEEVLDFLREYHGALGPLVSQFEGTLDQFSGDGIMVFFNDPVPCSDPAERAVKMTLAMREAAAKLIAAWRRRGRELGFGAGIAQGYATLGQIGFAERSGYTAIGTVCNVAARLCAEAKDGQILLSQRVAVAVEGTTTLEEIGALTLKGLTQPVVAYNVPLATSQPALRVIEGGPQS
jgi:GAF domain-containing protein